MRTKETTSQKAIQQQVAWAAPVLGLVLLLLLPVFARYNDYVLQVFTHALLQGLAGRADALDGNKEITLTEMVAWLSQRVPRLTDYTQQPILHVPGGCKDFAFARLAR